MRRWILVAALVAAASSHAVAARAQGEASVDEASEARARVHFQAGTSHFQVGDYESALREYTLAWELSGRLPLLYNIALCHERLGQLELAIDNLGRYLTEAEDVPDRPTLEQRLENMRERLARQASEPPPDEPERVHPPESTSPVHSEPRDELGRGGVHPAALAAFAGAGAGVLMFATFGGLALARDGDLEGDCSPTCDPTDDRIDQERRFAAVADVGLGLTLVGAALGVVFVFVLDDGGDDAAVALSPTVGPDGGGVSLEGRF